jgi:transcriptional antiterminator Rof (Rho-off)
MSDDYNPVSCASHSEYELYIMRRQRLRLAWYDETEVKHDEIVWPIDLMTHEHVEYLLVKDDRGEHKQIRLDRIIEAHPV